MRSTSAQTVWNTTFTSSWNLEEAVFYRKYSELIQDLSVTGFSLHEMKDLIVVEYTCAIWQC
jgi:hypothetical protein